MSRTLRGQGRSQQTGPVTREVPVDPLKTVEVTVETGEVLTAVWRLQRLKHVIEGIKVDAHHIGTNQD